MRIVKLRRAGSRWMMTGATVLSALACSAPPEAVVTEPALVAEPVGAPPALAAAPPPVAVAAPAPPPVVVPEPSHGGTVVMAGAHPVEVVPHASGQVYAYVLGAPPPAERAELTVIVPVTGGVRTVELAWEPGESRWAGRVRRAEIVPGPLDVVLVIGGERWIGHTTTIVVLPAIVVAPAPVVVIERGHGKHRKHRKHKHRGRGRGWGRGHGPVIRIH